MILLSGVWHHRRCLCADGYSDHDLDAVARAQGQRGGKTLFRGDRRPFLNALIPRIGGLDRI